MSHSSLKSNKSVTNVKKTKKRKPKVKPEFFLLENGDLTKMSSPNSNSHHLEGIYQEKINEEKKEKKGKEKTRKVKEVKEKKVKEKKEKTKKNKDAKIEEIQDEILKIEPELPKEEKKVKEKKEKTLKVKVKEIKEKKEKTRKVKEPKNKEIKEKNLKIPDEVVIMVEEEKKKRLNEEFIDLLDQLSNIMMKQGEVFRARAYQKAQETIMGYPDDIVSIDQLNGLPGIGSTIMEKLKEYVETGTLKVIEREKNNPVNFLGDIYGIGPKKAKELVDQGITTIEELEEKKDSLLNEVQRQGLKYHSQIMKRIPRTEIEEYEKVFMNAFYQILEKDQDAKFEIVGSYRRGAQQSGDIDVIITGSNNKVYNQFIDQLLEKGIILVVLSRGASKCLVIAKLPGYTDARRVDFLYTSNKEYPFAVLYFTGSKIFNTVMRQRALKRGYTFNEHGIYALEGKKKGEMVKHDFPDEKSIFDFLEMQYVEPMDRKDGRAVKDIVVVDGEMPLKDTMVPIKEEAPVKDTMVVDKPKRKQKTLKKKMILNQVENMDDLDNIIQSFKKMGIQVLEQLNEKQLAALIEYANQKYYNQTPLLTDNEFDIIKEYVAEKYPNNAVILEIGAPIEKNKVKLPYHMASMDKIKPDTGALESWTKKYSGPYVISCKLDGVSALYSTEKGTSKLYTRGNGTYGQDISYLIPHLRLPKNKDLTIRGELLITKADFEEHLKSKFANPRNLVSGIVNQKKVDPNIKYVHFVSYEVINPELKPSEQMKLLSSLDIEVVLNREESKISNELLSQLLIEWRKDYLYEIDGVIVTNDEIYSRKTGNPEHAFAFKMVLSDQIAEAKVVDVIWTPSKDGYLKPRVRIEPIQLGGVKIEYATGFNADFIEKNKIGIGALIQIIRSGDVIPHIKSVTVPAEEAKMPSVPYQWNATHIDVLLEDLENDPTVKEKNITGFFKGIKVEGLSSGNIRRIIDAGYDDVSKIVHMTESDFLKVEGFKQKLAHKIFTGIQEGLKKASLAELMSFSNLFGRGVSEKKIELIINEFPDILTSNKSMDEKINEISKIKGYTKKSAETFVEKIPLFLTFLEEAGLQEKLMVETKKPEVVLNHILSQKSIVFTGFRDKELMEEIKKVGGILGSSVSKNTFALLVKDKDEDTGKAAEARKIGVPLFTVDEFRKTYFS